MPNHASCDEGDHERRNNAAVCEAFFHRCLLENLPAGAYTCDAQGLITYYNQQALQILGRAPALENPVDRFCASFKLFSADGSPLDHENCWMARSLKEGNGCKENLSEEIIVERSDGERLSLLAYANPVHDDEGAPLGAINVLVDISERKRVENILREADHSKNTFLATLAHELRNPLAPLRNATEILHLKAPPVPELQWALEVIDRQMQQVTRLVDDLLDLGRITNNKFELRKARVALDDILEAALEASQPCIKANGLQLHVKASSDPVFIDGDITRLTQVVVNLLHNAAKYTKRGGEIWLTIEPGKHKVEITVQDTGIGISPEVLPHIFELFTQADQTSEWSPGGLGIGLTLARQVVDGHDGTITVCSDGLGQGSKFMVCLPVFTGSAQADATLNEGYEAAPVFTSEFRILVVDDDQDITDSLVMLMDIMGHKIRTASNGEQAMTVAENYRPDVMLLDIGMPRLNGYEVARQIRQQPWGEAMTLIACTGWGQEADKRRAREAGFDYHLIKPVDPQVLLKLFSSLAQDKTRAAPLQKANRPASFSPLH